MIHFTVFTSLDLYFNAICIRKKRKFLHYNTDNYSFFCLEACFWVVLMLAEKWFFLFLVCVFSFLFSFCYSLFTCAVYN